jgi:hypothetical protein
VPARANDHDEEQDKKQCEEAIPSDIVDSQHTAKFLEPLRSVKFLEVTSHDPHVKAEIPNRRNRSLVQIQLLENVVVSVVKAPNYVARSCPNGQVATAHEQDGSQSAHSKSHYLK